MNPLMQLLLQFLGGGAGGAQEQGQNFLQGLLGTGAPESWQKMLSNPQTGSTPQFWNPPATNASPSPGNQLTAPAAGMSAPPAAGGGSTPNLSQLLSGMMPAGGVFGAWSKPASL